MSDAVPVRRAVDSAGAADVLERVVSNLELAVRAPRETLELCVLGLLAEGHLIIEDFPGVGKTILAKSLARSLHLSFSRLQFTPDLLPTDVTGVNVFNQKTNEFEFRPGPVFANVLLVDEINRASPKTQSALLEAMQECQVTIDGVTYPLELPFLVVATQNPIEYEGTYALPEAQLDRFTARLSLGYPPLVEEARMLAEQTTSPPLERLRAVADRDDVLGAIAAARAVYVEESVGRYVVEVLRHTRESRSLALGASPRAGIALLRMAKARAVAAGRDYALPEDVQAVAVPVLAHRLIVAPEARACRSHRRGHGARGATRDPGPGMNRLGGALLLGLGVTVAALAFGSRPLGVAGLGLLLAAGAARAWAGSVREEVAVLQVADPAPAVEGARVRLEVEARRGSRMPVASATVRGSLGRLGPYECRLRGHGRTLAEAVELGRLPGGDSWSPTCGSSSGTSWGSRRFRSVP